MAMNLVDKVRKAAVPVLIAGTMVSGACAQPEIVGPSIDNTPNQLEQTVDGGSESVDITEPEVSIYRQFLLDNPETSEGFTENQFKVAEELLAKAPEVMNDKEFYEGFNGTIKGLTLDSSITLDSDKDLDDIVMPLWDYVYNGIHKGEGIGSVAHRTITIDGKEYSSLSKTALSQRLPNEKDRELTYIGLSELDGLQVGNATPSPDWGDWLTTPDGRPVDLLQGENALKKLPYYNIVPAGKASIIENLENMSALAENIMEVYNNPDLFLHQQAISMPESIPTKSFPNSESARNTYAELFKSDSELDLAMFIHGLTINLYNEDRIHVDRILGRALGIVFFEQRAPYLHGELHEGKIFTHGEPLYVIPSSILDVIEANPDEYGTPMVFRGQTIGWVPNYEVTGKTQDNIPFVDFIMPRGTTVLQLDNQYDLSRYIRNSNVRTIERSTLQLERKNTR